MNLSLSPLRSSSYRNYKYFPKSICDEFYGFYFYDKTPLFKWILMLLKVYSQLSKVSSMTPLGPFLHHPTA